MDSPVGSCSLIGEAEGATSLSSGRNVPKNSNSWTTYGTFSTPAEGALVGGGVVSLSSGKNLSKNSNSLFSTERLF